MDLLFCLDKKCPLQRAAREDPFRIAWISPSCTLTFAQLEAQTTLFISKLHQLGVGPGDRIAVMHPPCHEMISLFFAVFRLGASFCPLNSRLPPTQIKAALTRLSPKLAIFSFPFDSSLVYPATPSIPQSVFLFTSGSTGTPKIAVLSFENLLISASHSIPITSESRWLLSLPLFHVGGIGIMMRCILAKAAIVLDANHPDITHLSCVPTQLYRATPVYKNLSCVLLGGAPIFSYEKRLPIYMTYGLTEMSSMVVTRKHPPKIDGAYFLDRPLPKREIRLSEDGEIWVRGETLFQGYWENNLVPCGDWFATGDIGRYDLKEGLAILGRKDWQFISGGENIQPEEIEQHLLQIPEVLEAVVIPKPDPEFGFRPAAFIRTSNSSFSLKKMQKILADVLPKYKIPISLVILDEIPKNGLKVDRKKIIEKLNL